MEYPKFRVGDRVVVLATAKEAEVAAFKPSETGAGYNYTFKYDDGSERTLPEWALANPEEVVYCVVWDEASDDGCNSLDAGGAYRKRENAVKRLADIADQWRENMGGYADAYETETDDGCFEAWRDGYYNDDHFAARIAACRLE